MADLSNLLHLLPAADAEIATRRAKNRLRAFLWSAPILSRFFAHAAAAQRVKPFRLLL
jgi:hypothetical protein